jgi:predicted nucleic acid-binding protein
VANVAVINASPLIFLSRSKHFELLRRFADKILVPEPVAREIQAKGVQDITAQTLINTAWLEFVTAPTLPEAISAWALGAGESAVLAIAYAHPGMEAIIDDLAGRRCAALLGIPVRGTLGLVLTAKQRGYIPAARTVMEDLIKAGLYLSQAILDEALKRVDE